TNQTAKQKNYLIGMLRSSRIIPLPARLKNTLNEYVKNNSKQVDAEAKEKLRQTFADAYKKIHLPLEKEVMKAQMELYTRRVSTYNFLQTDAQKNEISGENGVATLVEQIFANSIFINE